MATKVTLLGSETIDFNLKVENQAKYFYKFKTWTPIMGALLLSGIVLTDYWRNLPEPSKNSMRSSLLDQFDQLMKRIPEKDQKRLCGLDGEVLTTYSIRFHEARKVVRKWDEKCEDEDKYPSELAPWEFVAWLEEVCWGEEIRFFDRTWLDAFLKLHGIGPNKIMLPANVMESFLKVTDIGDDGGRHPLGPDIFQAQQQAKSRGNDPYAIEVIFPLVFRILDERGAIDESNEKYVPGKTLSVKLDDRSIYDLKRDSLRVQLGRLKKKYFQPPQ